MTLPVMFAINTYEAAIWKSGRSLLNYSVHGSGNANSQIDQRELQGIKATISLRGTSTWMFVDLNCVNLT